MFGLPNVAARAKVAALTALDALDRIEMPDAVAETLSEMLWAGAALIVSDNEMSHETTDFAQTDFVVLTRGQTLSCTGGSAYRSGRAAPAYSGVIEAGAYFHEGGRVSITTIADRLWLYWTEKKVTLQSLLMRLGEREARFEPSIAVSELDLADAAAIDSAPPQLPVHQKSNRIQFRHDLAADWARFQRLKEIANETDKWAAYAGNPLWHNSLRMLGELLLRERKGSLTSWDIAFQKAQEAGESTPLAADLLLDALYLDNNAGASLAQGRTCRFGCYRNIAAVTPPVIRP